MAFTKTQLSWAIKSTDDDEGRSFLIGYGFFGWSRPDHFGGYVTATFQTRKIAAAITKVLNSRAPEGTRYKVVRVKIAMTVCK